MNEGALPGRVEKDLAKLRRSKAGWGQAFYARLLGSAGFLSREGKKHTIYVDPDDANNFVIVPRHGELLGYVADEVVRAVEARIKRLRERSNEEKNA